ncbi:MAG: HEAT repeat domain-containing protein [Cellvibrio sp.]|uniref:HEAT repeat domain-containing protein n=1 Tax=Cellvibrio sp. TaxID=1965322 RepID=UPI00271EDB27|nr:HEAT repeat domain-containing protein [Cellvibrio sp.]
MKKHPLGIPFAYYLHRSRPSTFSRTWLATSIASIVLLTECGDKTPQTPTANNTAQSSSAASSVALDITRINPEEAKKTAATIESQVELTLAKGITGELWASEQLMGDTVAIHVDDKGRIWAGITQRSNNSEFDIRNYPDWEHRSVAFRNIDDRRAFLKKELAPENSAQNTRILDRNKDGSHDWHDLTVMKEKVIRLEDTSGSGKADFVQTVVEGFNTEVTDVIGGMFYSDLLDELFVNIAPDFWSLKDTNNDGQMDEKKSLAHGYAVHIGFSGHGMSGATMGPDGKMYYSMGDVGTVVTDANGKTWNYPDQGVIVRSEPDGSNFEVFAHGLRNIYEFSFDKYGNFISVDNDGDHVGEYERVVHLIEGSDTGWRINWQLGKYKDPKNNSYKPWMDEKYYTPRFKDQAAHILPPVAPYYSGPTGMTYNPGTAFNDQWKDHFFVVEFVGSAARAGINAFTLKPKGASFELDKDENIFRGVLATGLDFGPDGAMYMSDWIEGWGLKQKGRVWKLDTPDTAGNAIRKETQALLAEDLRLRSAEDLVTLLSHVDMRVRQKAQFILVDKGARNLLETQAQNATDEFARIHAIWGLGQLLRKDASVDAVLISLLKDSNSEIRAQAAKVLGDANHVAATDALLPLLGDKNPRAQLYAAQALGRIGAKTATAAIVDMLAANNDEDVYLRQAGAIALARIGDDVAIGKLATHSSEAVRIAAVVALKQMASPALAAFLNDKSEYVVTNAARAISDDTLVTDALPALAAYLDKPTFTNEQLLRRVINANVYAKSEANTTADNAERLIRFASQKKMAGILRADAVHALASWGETSAYDRVTGTYRGAIKHQESEAITALSTNYKTLLADSEAEVRAATVNAIADLNIRAAQDQLATLLTKDSAPQVRIAALHTLKKFAVDNMGDLAFVAMKDKNQSVRTAALALVPELNVPAQQVVEMHSLLLKNGTTGEQQAALMSLANVKAPEAIAVFKDQMTQLIAGKIAPEVQLELITAVEKIKAPELIELLSTYQNSKDKTKPVDMFRESLLGGNPEQGKNIFLYSNTSQCVRCHKVGGSGASVGPNLTTIAKTLSREQLLEAMVDPGARVSPGFGPVSGMPPMGLLLRPDEIRDLVAYLSTLTEEVHEGH